MMCDFLMLVVLMTISYTIGSVCSAVIVSRIYHLPDPKQNGSNNPGATNVLRLAGKKYAIIVLIADGLKGFLPVFVAHLWNVSLVTQSYLCFAVTLGHIYPIFFRFKGGKGVATAVGALWGLNLLLGSAI